MLNSMDYSLFNPGSKFISRDGRIFTLLYVTDDRIWLKFGPGVDEISSWSFDGSADEDDISDADLVGVLSSSLFDSID